MKRLGFYFKHHFGEISLPSDMGLLISSLHLLDCKCGGDILLYLHKTYKCVIYIFYIYRERSMLEYYFL